MVAACYSEGLQHWGPIISSSCYSDSVMFKVSVRDSQMTILAKAIADLAIVASRYSRPFAIFPQFVNPKSTFWGPSFPNAMEIGISKIMYYAKMSTLMYYAKMSTPNMMEVPLPKRPKAEIECSLGACSQSGKPSHWYNFSCMSASNSLFTSRCGFSGSSYSTKTLLWWELLHSIHAGDCQIGYRPHSSLWYFTKFYSTVMNQVLREIQLQ